MGRPYSAAGALIEARMEADILTHHWDPREIEIMRDLTHINEFILDQTERGSRVNDAALRARDLLREHNREDRVENAGHRSLWELLDGLVPAEVA